MGKARMAWVPRWGRKPNPNQAKASQYAGWNEAAAADRQRFWELTQTPEGRETLVLELKSGE